MLIAIGNNNGDACERNVLALRAKKHVKKCAEDPVNFLDFFVGVSRDSLSRASWVLKHYIFAHGCWHGAFRVHIQVRVRR